MEKEEFSVRLNHFIQEHKSGILGTLMVHALFLFILVILEISQPKLSEQDIFLIELQQELDILPEMLPPEMRHTLTGYDDEDLKNEATNEADQNKSFDDYYKEFQDIVDQSKSNEKYEAEDYEDKRNLIRDYSKENGFQVTEEKEDKKQQNQNNNSNNKGTYAGPAIISYNLGGRKASNLPVPAYKCVGKGEVVVEITVNQKGYVTSATVVSSSTPLNEDCLPESARNAASHSRFQIDLKAPSSQKGTITYKFIAQ